jgi:hypothetical protein
VLQGKTNHKKLVEILDIASVSRYNGYMREKPDWAERLQRTFKRKYDLGYAEGHKVGWNEGFEVGSKKAINEAKKVFVKRIQKEIEDVSTSVDIEGLNGLNRAIDLIRKGK